MEYSQRMIGPLFCKLSEALMISSWKDSMLDSAMGVCTSRSTGQPCCKAHLRPVFESGESDLTTECSDFCAFVCKDPYCEAPSGASRSNGIATERTLVDSSLFQKDRDQLRLNLCSRFTYPSAIAFTSD